MQTDALTTEEKRALEELIRPLPNGRAACIDALAFVQRRRGSVSDALVRELAALVGLSPTELDSVATFYNMIFRRPAGRHVVQVCDSISCWIMGCDRAIEHLEARLGVHPGETTKDGNVTLLTVPCLGLCHRAPAVSFDFDLLPNATPEKLDERLRALGSL